MCTVMCSVFCYIPFSLSTVNGNVLNCSEPEHMCKRISIHQNDEMQKKNWRVLALQVHMNVLLPVLALN